MGTIAVYNGFSVSDINLKISMPTISNFHFGPMLSTGTKAYSDVIGGQGKDGYFVLFTGHFSESDDNIGTVNTMSFFDSAGVLMCKVSDVSVPLFPLLFANATGYVSHDGMTNFFNAYGGLDLAAAPIVGTESSDFRMGTIHDDVISGLGGSDTLSGRDGNDEIRGGLGNDSLLGGNGLDSMFGGSGRDTLHGDANKDKLYGGDGDDRLLGGGGMDTLTGGLGHDRYIFNTGAGIDRITDFKDGIDHIVIAVGAERFSQVAVHDSGVNAVIMFSNVTVTLANFDYTHITASDFIFV